MNILESTQNKVRTIPGILWANTYYWKPGCNASMRRTNESYRLQEVKTFFDGSGWETYHHGDSVKATRGNWVVRFSFSESCAHVYKTAHYYYRGRQTNLKAFLNDFSNQFVK
jgi:hypothetical protein